jgi:hypothetical protein
MIIDKEPGDPGGLSRPEVALPPTDPHQAEIIKLGVAVMTLTDVPE